MTIATQNVLGEIRLEGVTLTQEHLSALPSSVTRKVIRGYEKAVRGRDNLGPLSLQLENGRISFRRIGAENGSEPVTTSDSSALLSALSQLQDAARRRMSAKFTDKFQYNPNRPAARPSSGPSSYISEGSSIIVDCNSAVRNTCNAVGKAAVFIPFSLLVGGTLGIGIGLNASANLFSSAISSAKSSDGEGVVQNLLNGGVLLSYAALSSTLVLESGMLNNLAQAVGSSSPLVSSATLATLGIATNALAVAMYGGLAISAGYALSYLLPFRSELVDILDRQGISSEDKAVEGLLFLQQQIAWTEGDEKQLVRDYPDVSEQTAVREKRLEAKWDRFVRRVGPAIADRVVNESKGLIEGIRSKDKNALKEAAELLQQADRDNHAKVTKQYLYLLIAMIGLPAAFLPFLGVDAMISSILFGVGAAAWLLVDSRDVNAAFSRLAYRDDTLAARQRRWVGVNF